MQVRIARAHKIRVPFYKVGGRGKKLFRGGGVGEGWSLDTDT
jgi:hypothetical protein